MSHILHQSLIMMMNIKGSYKEILKRISLQDYDIARLGISQLSYGRNANKNAGRNKSQWFNIGNASDESKSGYIQLVPRTESTPCKANVQCYNCNEKGHYARKSQKPKVRDAKYFREQMLLAMKDEAGEQPQNEENDFYVALHMEKDLDELTASVQVHASFKVYEQVSYGKRKTIIQTTDDDQVDSNIIFDDPFVDNNGGMSEHDSTTHDEYLEIQMLAYNVQRKAKNQKCLNNELKKQKDLLQRELETIKDRKLSSHDRIVYKMVQSIQTIQMLGKKPNKVYDPFLKAGLGYTNHVHLKKAIAAQPKLYDGDLIYNNKLLNALYETFVPQQELSAEQTYFSIPSTSDNGTTSKDVPSESPDVTQKTYAYANVRAQNQDLLMTFYELKSKLKTIDKWKHVNTKFDKSETLGQLLCVTPFNKNIAIKAKNVSNTKVTSDRSNPVTLQSTSTIEKK
ncbi:retrovirus-related pol polyprotein from transposon TNT 1-94 [Tanacetum coccineum]|uniref:Retrovirus-related pol polyprotein from transposon TNT 1-94 n=1 Tax=Tanacetum coccineum TaxID=301880 RepID=A0ABQ5GAX9_9ASTR